MTTESDPELSAMSQTLHALSSLDQEAQMRVLSWVTSKLGLKDLSPAPDKLSPSRNGSFGGSVTDRKVREGTINSATIKLGADSCRTLLVAAAAYLSIYRGMESFTRKEWITCAREARMWKSDYSTQTSVNISRLLESEDIFEKSKDVFAISMEKLNELEAALAK
jgi:hypothetical protein